MKEIYLPALRGIFGSWVYYSSMMHVVELAKRVNFAEELHKDKELSKLIQRELKKTRSKEISEYMLSENERFMNTLVVAIYGGDPSWYPADLKANNPEINQENISEDALNTLGFLKLSGREKLFALDGQHRLAGLKKLIENDDFTSDDEISVIFVGHENSDSGIERTRRLFTTLNKKAVPVSKGEIIALDENDLMAIVCRKLIENSEKFGNKRIAIKTTNNLSTNDKVSLTTLGNLYDLLGIVFSKIYKKGKPIELKNYRNVTMEVVDEYYQIALDFFGKLESTFPELNDFFNLDSFQSVVENNRTENGGSILFRPVGLTIVFELIQFLVAQDKMKIDEAFDKISEIPLELSEAPYKNTIWISSSKNMYPRGRVTVRDKLLLSLNSKYALNKKDDINKKYESFLTNNK